MNTQRKPMVITYDSAEKNTDRTSCAEIVTIERPPKGYALVSAKSIDWLLNPLNGLVEQMANGVRAELEATKEAHSPVEPAGLSYNWITHLHEHGCGHHQYDLDLFKCVEAYILNHSPHKQANSKVYAPELPYFAKKILRKLARFNEQVEDSASGGTDIGSHWLEMLTRLSLLNRTHRRPALWELSQQGEDLLKAAKKEAQSPATPDEIKCCHKTMITRCDGCPHAHKEVQS